MKCETIPDLEKFLAIQEQALGPASPEVATTLTKLAELYFAQDDVAKAEQLYQRAFEIRSVLHGYNRQGIEIVEQRLKEIRLAQAHLGDKPATNSRTESDTAAPAIGESNNAAMNAQFISGKHSVAAQSISGTNNPISLVPPSMALNSSKAINVAIQDAELELELLKQMVGEEHPSVADLLTKVADLYCRLKMYAKMEPLLVDALKIRENACGPEHPSVSTELKNLGTLYCAQERYALAEPLLKRAISLRERAYGRTHNRVADVEAQYAYLLRKTNRAAQAEALERHVHEIRNNHDTSSFSCDSSFFGAAKPRR